ncbi:MAG: M23 family metallopeptidase [Proteobacteria bacterium]|nr:M23 family metallopeptidase [Pseudomonadota bacterium]
MGIPIYAVADGVVEKVIDLELDYPAGTPVNLSSRANSITIKHINTRSSYVHLKQYSAQIKVGEKVK